MDIMGPLPETESRFILVLTDYFTKWTEAYALKDHMAETVARTLMDEFICQFGVPYSIHTDQGGEFESNLFKEICNLLEIEKTITSPYHPQSDGQVER